MTNVKVRFEILKNTNVLEVVEYKVKKGSLREILLRIKYDKTQLFVGVKQSKGNDQNYVNILIPAKLKTKGQQWIANNFSITLLISRKKEYKSIVLKPKE